MTGSGWILFAIGWIASNVVGKLLLDSIERTYRNEINSTVKQLPLKIKDMSTKMVMNTRNRLLIVFLEIIRIVAMVFFLPWFLTLSAFPFLRRNHFVSTHSRFVETLYSRDWMVLALILLEVFSWKGLLLCILCVFQLSSVEGTDTPD